MDGALDVTDFFDNWHDVYVTFMDGSAARCVALKRRPEGQSAHGLGDMPQIEIRAGGEQAKLAASLAMKFPKSSWAGAMVVALLFVLFHAGSARASEECLTCHIPGGGLVNSKGKNIEVHGDALKKSVHTGVDCVGCHAGAAKEGHTSATAAPRAFVPCE
jgi:hypothetical protein